MATQTLVAAADYLKSSFGERDCEFVHGEVVDRTMPTYLHSKLQALLAHLFFRLAETYRLFPATEFRLALQPGFVYRIPDVSLFSEAEPSGDVADFPPLLVVEINSPDDRMSANLKKFAEYQAFGVKHIWFIDGEEAALYCYEGNALRKVNQLELPEFDFKIGLGELGLKSPELPGKA